MSRPAALAHPARRRFNARRLLLAGLVLALGLPALLLGALRLAVQPAPTVAVAPQPTVADIARANQLLKRHDPRHTRPGVIRAATLSPRDVQLLLGQAAQRLGVEPRSQLMLGTERAEITLSLPLARLPALAARLPAWAGADGGWLNLRLQVQQTEQLPRLSAVRIGHLPLPAFAVSWALPLAVRAMGLQAPQALAADLINRVVITRSQVVVAFAWPADLQQRLSRSLLSPAEHDRMKVYSDHLNGLTTALRQELGSSSAVPLPRLLQPMFELAQQRSTQGGAAGENRAALLTLAAWVGGKDLRALVPMAPPRHMPAPLIVTLAGRIDTSQHYLVSAALAIEGGGPLSDAVGLYKEVLDARGGSGFSFNDLAADRAGTRFGLLAGQAPELVQSRLAAGIGEHDLLPPVADLPESMQDPEFARRFGGVGAPAYRRLMTDIESRLDRLPLLAPPAAGQRS